MSEVTVGELKKFLENIKPEKKIAVFDMDMPLKIIEYYDTKDAVIINLE